jgi:hypothetical protein
LPEQEKLLQTAKGKLKNDIQNGLCAVGCLAHLPILVLRSMHCEMCGNCRIFLHFLLLPLLLSALGRAVNLQREPEQNQGRRESGGPRKGEKQGSTVTFSCLEVDRVGHDVLQFHEFQFDCGAGAGAGLEPRPIHTRSDTRRRPVRTRVRTPTDPPPALAHRHPFSACFQDGGAPFDIVFDSAAAQSSPGFVLHTPRLSID